MVAAHVGTRVVLVQAGSSISRNFAGVVIEERQERYLKQFVVRCDGGAIRYASAHELALEGDPTRTPLGPRSIVF
jgi:hypothetical protein